jgi:hypothetical protein
MRLWNMVAAVAVAASMAGGARAESCGADEATLRQLKLEAWPGFYQRQDVEGLGRFLAPGFEVIGADGKATGREEELRWLAANPWRAEGFRYTIARVSCPVPGTAIVTGEGRSIRRAADGTPTEHRYTSSNVLVKRDGTWRAVLSHVSGVRTGAP